MALNQTRQIIRRDYGGESHSMQLKQPPCLIMGSSESVSVHLRSAHSESSTLRSENSRCRLPVGHSTFLADLPLVYVLMLYNVYVQSLQKDQGT